MTVRDDPLLAQHLERGVAGVPAGQHQHEQEQHHDRAGVDDDLHEPEELGVLRDVQAAQAQHGQHQPERRVHRALWRTPCRPRRAAPAAPGSRTRSAPPPGVGRRRVGRRGRGGRGQRPSGQHRRPAHSRLGAATGPPCPALAAPPTDRSRPTPRPVGRACRQQFGSAGVVVVLVAQPHRMRRLLHPGQQRGQQHVLGVDQPLPVVVGQLVLVGHGQRPGRAGLDAQPAADAAQVVDLVVLAVPLAGRVTLLVGVVARPRRRSRPPGRPRRTARSRRTSPGRPGCRFSWCRPW